MYTFSPKISEALEFAAIAHKEQVRKGGAGAPYISHPAAVGLILARAAFPEPVIIAGILHDVIEDTKFTATDIEKQFGPEVAALVKEVSEDRSLIFADRKEQYVEHLKTASSGAKAVSAADLLANHTSVLILLERGEDPWTIFTGGHERTVAFWQRRLEATKVGFNHPLIAELEEAQQKIINFT